MSNIVAAPPLLLWTGECLQLSSEPWMKIFLKSRVAVAAAILRLTCRELNPTAEEAEAFAVEVLDACSYVGGFSMEASFPGTWLGKRRYWGGPRVGHMSVKECPRVPVSAGMRAQDHFGDPTKMVRALDVEILRRSARVANLRMEIDEEKRCIAVLQRERRGRLVIAKENDNG
jgi:hypothetical protein